MLHTAWVGILVFVLDRISKQLVMDNLAGAASRVVWPGILSFTYTKNTGMAFSILANRTWLLIVLSIIALVLMVVALKGALQETKMRNMLLWMLLAGGFSNLLDRLLFGYVVDFIEVMFFRFPIFNVADISLTVAAVCLIIALLRSPKESVSEQKTA